MLLQCRSYYLGKRKSNRKTKRIIVLVLLFCLVLSLNKSVFSLVFAISSAEIKNKFVSEIHRSVYNQLNENSELYSNLATLSKKADGSVASLEINQAKLLYARTMLLTAIMSKLQSADFLNTEIPLGNLSGINLLSGLGPKITVRSFLSKNLNAYFESSFTEVGINQSLYEISFVFCCEFDLLIPSKKDKITLTQSFPVMSTVVLGEVPDAYTEIVRLTDDITESDIDDIYDFGAELN